MVQIQPGTGRRKRPSTKGAYVLRVSGGRVYAQSWPRPRGKSRIPYQAAQNERMRLAARAVKRWPAEEQNVMRQGLDQFLRQNRGVRGTAAIRLRDWLTSILTGRAWSLSLPDGTPLRSAAQIRDCSDFLDILEPRIGSLVTRTAEGWYPTWQCKPQAVLCCLPPRPLPGACPPASPADKRTAIGGW